MSLDGFLHEAYAQTTFMMSTRVWRCSRVTSTSGAIVTFWRLQVIISTRCSGVIRVLRFIQVKSSSHYYGHAVAITSHPYFGIVVWFKSTVGAISTAFFLSIYRLWGTSSGLIASIGLPRLHEVAARIQKPAMSPNCLLGVVPQPTDSLD